MLLAGIGELLWDIYTDGKYPGGGTFNVVHHVQQLGHEGMVISRIGNDAAGKELVRILHARGFNTSFVQRDSSRETGYVTVLLDENAEPEFTCSDSAPYDYLDWDEQYAEIAPKIKGIVFGTFAQRNEHAASVTKKFLQACCNAVKIFDVNFRDWNKTTQDTVSRCLPLTDIIKMNEYEMYRMREVITGLPEESAACLPALVKQKQLKLACLTAGKWGCLISDGTETVYCPGVKTKPVDTTGAGDAFIAALAIKYLEGEPLLNAGRFANIVALQTILKKGATPVYTLDAIREIERVHREFNVKEKWSDYLNTII